MQQWAIEKLQRTVNTAREGSSIEASLRRRLAWLVKVENEINRR